ncbi:MAG: EVE domain-containing protein [Gammaproteobacteria bacterium]|nr:EVE domain-containing protein [Gammaproteobacteria bacterium]
MNYWLMKTEPDVFGIDHLRKRPKQTEHWDGVRNYQARNMLRDQMQVGDLVFFYHSNCAAPGIVGIARIVRAGYPDHTAGDPESTYYDPKSTPDNTRWDMVDVKFERKFARVITLDELKTHVELADMQLLRRGNRLSIMPVSVAQWQYILDLE